MTVEEKVKEIEESRKVATENPDGSGENKANPQADEKKPAETDGGKKPEDGDKKPEGDQKPDGDKKPDEGGKKPEDKTGAHRAEPTEAEKQQKAFAELRFENKKLKERLAKIEAAQKPKDPPTEQRKKLSDFNGDTDAYGKYLYESLSKEITEKLTKQLQEQREKEQASKEETDGIRKNLEAAFGKERTDSIWADMANPESMMSQILTDERGKAIVDFIKSSKRNADMLALMQAKPQIFQELLEFRPEKQNYRLCALEDAIDAIYAELSQKKSQEEQKAQQKQEQAANVPVTGVFGVNGNGTTDFSTLSAEERVARLKEELRKNNSR